MIAEGAFGAVYKGCYLPTGQVVAVKIVKLEEDETFEDLVVEIEVLSKCHHPNVVGYFGCWCKGDELHVCCFSFFSFFLPSQTTKRTKLTHTLNTPNRLRWNIATEGRQQTFTRIWSTIWRRTRLCWCAGRR